MANRESDTGESAAYASMAYPKVIARAWSDPAFKQQLMADPRAVLTAEGIAVAQGVTIRVVENTDNLLHLVLPTKPADHELSVEDMQFVLQPRACCNRCQCPVTCFRR